MRRAGWVVAALAAAALGGCGADADGEKLILPPTPTYPALSTPQNVLLALAASYQNRDSLEYKTLYDPAYLGTSTDLNDPPGSQVSTFSMADEVAHIATLRRTTTIVQVVFDLGPQGSWTRLSSDDPSHPEWAQIQIAPGSFRVEIYDGQTLYEAQSINPVTFHFSPTVAAPADTTWRIVRWNEVGSGAT
jgi:hypothetical protein